MIGAAAFGGAILLLPFAPRANAACSQWDISGEWGIEQTNGPHINVEIQQDGNNLRGSGLGLNWSDDDSYGKMEGTLDGSIEEDDFEFTVYWSRDVIGVYKGSINSRGRLEGSTYDRMNPKSTALWHSTETGGKCADVASQPAPTQAPAPKPKTADEKLLQGVKKIPKQFGTSPQ
jgi:hypothetical protein